MKNRDRRLIAQVERDALDATKDLSEALRKCIILGGKAGSVSLRECASRELTGYGPNDELPEYRTVGAPIKVDAITFNAQIRGQRISPRVLPAPLREAIDESHSFRSGVGELEGVVDQYRSQGHVRISLPMGADVADLLNYANGDPDQKITAVYYEVSIASIRAILDRIRTTLVSLIAEMRAGMPDDEDVPSAGIADQAVSVAVYGKGSRVTVNNSQAKNRGKSTVSVGGAAPDQTPFWTRSRKIGSFIVGIMTVAGAIAAIIAALN
ncbi:hypothetical protein F7Q99_28370 [Streptomyces kaniharaensis]|uniref:AbiTii domain-containing protein n=1 Tax=Streptomyces kaniharaensis TaxID=212423 RepID=A0A6N7KWL1_9ACTN|nr:hypothetical protein [Streptomyces kaniharaensis]MQS16052.1 hypothetical protein [Streptomyces kaniharaensis]